MKTLVIFLVIATIFSFGCIENSVTYNTQKIIINEYITDSSYFPLQTGNKWKYNFLPDTNEALTI